MSKQSRKQGVKKSEKTLEWCGKIIEDLKTGDVSSYDLQKKYGIEERVFPSILLQLTYLAPIYDYKKGGKLFLSMMK